MLARCLSFVISAVIGTAVSLDRWIRWSTLIDTIGSRQIGFATPGASWAAARRYIRFHAEASVLKKL